MHQEDAVFQGDLKVGQMVEERFRQRLVATGRHVAAERMEGYFGDYDIIGHGGPSGGLTYEVKFDRYAMKHKSAFICIEYFYDGEPSGISKTKADVWVQYDGRYFYVLTVRHFKDWISINKAYLRRVRSGKGAQSVLVPISGFCGREWCEMVEDRFLEVAA